jgi:predicted nuclease of predicted toxin-antitoxin system
MLRLLIDENFDQRILRGLKLEIPSIDYIVVQETNLKGLRDPLLLAWAAENQRIIVTHDVNTMPRHAYERVRAGQPMVGVIVISEDLAVGKAIEELGMLVECCEPEELNSQVKYLPI